MSLDLELVLGFTSGGSVGLAMDMNSSLVAYPASGVLVLLDTQTSVQANYLVLQRNVVTSSCFSKDGQLIVTGEKGYRPAVRVWNVQSNVELVAFFGHTYGIRTVLFSPLGDEIVSIGMENDNLVNVWAWPGGHLKATNNSSDPVVNAAFSEDGSFFVTVGRGHLKFWYPRISEKVTEASRSKASEACPLPGRPGELHSFKESIFVDVDCGGGWNKHFVYAVTLTGQLAVLRAANRQLTELISMDTSPITCVKSYDVSLFLGLANGEVVVMSPLTKEILAVLPRPKVGVGCHDNTCVRCLVFNPRTMLTTIVYANKTMSVLDLVNFDRICQRSTCMFHQNAISGVDIFTPNLAQGHQEALVTTSHDSTVRIWDMVTSDVVGNNGLTVLFLKKPTDYKSVDTPESNGTQKAMETITALRVISEGDRMVLGTKDGCVYVYSSRQFLYETSFQVHLAEITCFAHLWNVCGRCLLASGSRDRTVHVMDASTDYRKVSTLAFHSSPVNDILFVQDGAKVSLITCSIDRTVNLCVCKELGKERHDFLLERSVKKSSTPVDIALDKVNPCLAIACQDGRISVCKTNSLEECRAYRACLDETAQLHKILLCPNSEHLLTATSDKLINVLEFQTGKILSSVSGNNDRVTSMVFTHDGRHVISASTSGCLFAWRFVGSQVQETKLSPPVQHVPHISKLIPDCSATKSIESVNSINADSAVLSTSSQKLSGGKTVEIKSILKKTSTSEPVCPENVSKKSQSCSKQGVQAKKPISQTASRTTLKKSVGALDGKAKAKSANVIQKESPERGRKVHKDEAIIIAPLAMSSSIRRNKLSEEKFTPKKELNRPRPKSNQAVGLVKCFSVEDTCQKSRSVRKLTTLKRTSSCTLKKTKVKPDDPHCSPELPETKQIMAVSLDTGMGPSKPKYLKRTNSEIRKKSSKLKSKRTSKQEKDMAQNCMTKMNKPDESDSEDDFSTPTNGSRRFRGISLRTDMSKALLGKCIVIGDRRRDKEEKSSKKRPISEEERSARREINIFPIIELKNINFKTVIARGDQCNEGDLEKEKKKDAPIVTAGNSSTCKTFISQGVSTKQSSPDSKANYLGDSPSMVASKLENKSCSTSPLSDMRSPSRSAIVPDKTQGTIENFQSEKGLHEEHHSFSSKVTCSKGDKGESNLYPESSRRNQSENIQSIKELNITNLAELSFSKDLSSIQASLESTLCTGGKSLEHVQTTEEMRNMNLRDLSLPKDESLTMQSNIESNAGTGKRPCENSQCPNSPININVSETNSQEQLLSKDTNLLQLKRESKKCNEQKPPKNIPSPKEVCTARSEDPFLSCDTSSIQAKTDSNCDNGMKAFDKIQPSNSKEDIIINLTTEKTNISSIESPLPKDTLSAAHQNLHRDIGSGEGGPLLEKDPNVIHTSLSPDGFKVAENNFEFISEREIHRTKLENNFLVRSPLFKERMLAISKNITRDMELYEGGLPFSTNKTTAQPRVDPNHTKDEKSVRYSTESEIQKAEEENNSPSTLSTTTSSMSENVITNMQSNETRWSRSNTTTGPIAQSGFSPNLNGYTEKNISDKKNEASVDVEMFDAKFENNSLLPSASFQKKMATMTQSTLDCKTSGEVARSLVENETEILANDHKDKVLSNEKVEDCTEHKTRKATLDKKRLFFSSNSPDKTKMKCKKCIKVNDSLCDDEPPSKKSVSFKSNSLSQFYSYKVIEMRKAYPWGKPTFKFGVESDPSSPRGNRSIPLGNYHIVKTSTIKGPDIK